MKKLSLLIVIALCAGFLLSSCSRLENISVSKRHYRGGYHVDFGSPKQGLKPRTDSKAVTPAAMPSASVTAKEKNTVAAEKEIPAKASADVSAPAEKKKQVAKPATANVYASRQDVSSVREEAKAEELNSLITSLSDDISNSSSSSEDLPLWAMILFCIILPPLAVALKFGIVDKFWISVLLTLLFWIPGVIYALVVVLD